MSEPISRFLSGVPGLHFLEWNPTAPRTLLLLHGNTANAWWWRPMADSLAVANLRLLALDLRGHGDSQWVRPPAYAPMDYADDVVRLIEGARAEGAIAVGHSMGGIAALAFASRYHSLVRALAVIDVAISSGPRRRHYMRRRRAIPTVLYPDLATARARFRLMPNEGAVAAELLSEIAEHSIHRTTAGGYTMKFDRESFLGSDGLDVAAAIASVRVPLLLVRGEHSRIMTAEAASNACRANPLVELVTIPNAHHHIPLQAPASLARVIEQFVATHT